MIYQFTNSRERKSRMLSLRMRLSLLVAGTMLPLLMFAVGLVYVYHEQDRDAAFERVLETVRGIRLVLDNEIRSITAGLEVLALSQALQRDDIEGFRRDALAFLDRYGSESALVLGDREGHQLLNTRVPAGQPLPPRRNLLSSEEVFRTGRPLYSPFFTGSVSNTRIITVDVPVRRAGETVYVLSFNPPLSLFQTMVGQQRPNDEWTVSIFDQNGINFARVPNPEQTIGQRASPTLYAELFKANEAKVNTVSLEGVPLLTAFTRSPLTGWTVAAGLAGRSIEAPLWRTMAITAAIGAALLAVGLWFAIGMATRIARGEALNELLINELNHRIKNTLSTVQSFAVQTFSANADPAEARPRFEERLVALGRAHSLLSDEKWEGADVRSIAQSVMEPYALEPGRVRIAGPEIRMPPSQALMLSMVLHELATNAAKYGALSNAAGRVSLEWRRDPADGMTLTWQESGGPPVKEPTRKGFGSRLIANGFKADGGSTDIAFNESGLTCTIRCMLPAA